MVETYKLSQTEFQAISKLDGADRYAHLLKRAADWELVWGLHDGSDWVIAGDDQHNTLFPIWPHPDYAAACATGPWSGNKPAPIDLTPFLNEWLPGLALEGVLIAAFPTPALQGVAVASDTFREHLNSELEQYE